MKSMLNTFLFPIFVITALAGCQANNTPIEREGTNLVEVELKPRVDPDICDDDNVCTIDQVEPVSKLCTYTPKANCCSTSTSCGSGETCNLGTNKCEPIACDDGNLCTNDTNVNGACVYTQVNVDDNVTCTADACTPQGGVTHTPIANCCTADANCGTAQVCNQQTHMCEDVPCAADNDVCTTAKVVNHECVQERDPKCCTSNSQCYQKAATSWGYSAACGANNTCATGYKCIEGSMCLPLAYDFGCTVDPIDSPNDFSNGVATVKGTCEMCADRNQDGNCAGTETFCSGGLDEDADGLVDCADSDCQGKDECDGVECTTAANCDDGDPCTTDSCSAGNDCVNTFIAGCVECTTNTDCASGKVCGTNGTCVDPTCTPSCSDKECGDNGCGGSCGSCGSGDVCSSGQCVESNSCTTNAQCNDSISATADICFQGACHHVAPGQCGPFAIKFVPSSGSTGGPLEFWKAGSTGTPRTLNNVGAGTYASQVGECSVGVFSFHLTESKCITANGESPLRELPASPGIWGCTFNQ